MENVPQVHGKKNINDFNMWIDKLKELGYSNYYKDLNAKDFGIPQNRNRCFMISILGDYRYEFPEPVELKLKLRDLLENDVNEKYYLSDSMKDYISNSNEKWTGNNDKSLVNKEIASTLNTGEGSRRCDASNYICNDLPNNFNLKEIKLQQVGVMTGGKWEKMHDISRRVYSDEGLAPTLHTCGGGNLEPKILVSDTIGNNFIIRDTKQLKETIQQNEIVEGGSLDLYNRNVHNDGVSQTLDTGYHNAQRIAVKEYKEISELQRQVCNKALEKNLLNPTDIIDYSYSNSRLKEIENNTISIKNGTDNNISNTLTTNSGCFGICVENKTVYSETEKKLFTEDGNIKRYIQSDIVDKFEEGQMATTSFPTGYGHGPRTHDESICLNTIDKPSVKINLRIRKLIPIECFRLMGVKDEDAVKIIANQSDSSCYHLTGDGIVTNVLSAIFKKLLN